MWTSRRTEAVDPVAMSRVIAQSLLCDMRSSDNQRVNSLGAINLIRLLDIYESDSLRVRQSVGTLQRDDFKDLNGLRSTEGLERLKRALATAHNAHLPELSATEFVSRMRGVFQAFLKDAPQVNEAASEAKQFLTELTKALSSV